MPPTGIIKAEARKWRRPVIEHLKKPASLYLRSHLPCGKIGQSETGERRLLHEIRVV